MAKLPISPRICRLCTVSGASRVSESRHSDRPRRSYDIDPHVRVTAITG